LKKVKKNGTMKCATNYYQNKKYPIMARVYVKTQFTQ